MQLKIQYKGQNEPFLEFKDIDCLPNAGDVLTLWGVHYRIIYRDFEPIIPQGKFVANNFCCTIFVEKIK